MHAVFIPKTFYLLGEAGSRPHISNSTKIFFSFPCYIMCGQRAPTGKKQKRKIGRSPSLRASHTDRHPFSDKGR